MSIHKVIQKLDGVKKSQTGFLAKCPAHDDEKQSLAISDSGGKVLLNCFAGCPTAEIVSAIGMDWKDLFHDGNSIKQSFSQNGVMTFASPQPKIAHVYRYTDETGNLLYENVRYEPKNFKQRCTDGNGNQVWSLKGVRRVPYRLQQLTDSVRYGSDVWLCEGEKDADTLSEIGFIASSFKNWTKEFNKFIDKTNVIIVRDHDLPGGVQANEAARIITESAASVKVLDVWAESEPRAVATGALSSIPDKHGPDISDYVRTCVQDEGMVSEEIAERLSMMADNCPKWIDTGNLASSNLFIVKSGNQWLEDASKRPSPKMLFGEFWFQGELCILFADTNVGKSILAVQIGDAISKGVVSSQLSVVSKEYPANGIQGQDEKLTTDNRLPTTECEAQRVVYFDFELTDKQFESRLSERLPGADHHTNHYKFNDNFRRAEVNPETSDLSGFKTFEEFLNHSLAKTIVDEDADILIIDNLTYLRDETENARNALPLMKYLKELKSRHGISILALAHTPKRDSSKPLGRNDLQGSKMLINFCDSSFAIGESAKDVGLKYLKQIKARNTAIIYNADNVLLCNIAKNGSLLQFDFLGTGTEYEHLRSASEKDKDKLIGEVKAASESGQTQREISEAFGISLTTINRYLKQG